MAEVIHIIGIGGIGMSALAQVYIDRGYIVQGSDLQANQITNSLSAKGAKVMFGHHPTNIDDADIVIVSSAIAADNVEVIAAKQKGIAILNRKEALAQILKDSAQKSLLVTGSHGKTTVTSLLGHILHSAQKDPFVLSGGIIKNFDNNYHFGTGEYAVVEADESDATMSALPMHGGIITNLSAEHLEYYGSYQNLIAEMQKFTANIPKSGFLIMNADAKELAKLNYNDNNLITFGTGENARIRGYDINMNNEGIAFKVTGLEGVFQIPLYGMYNFYNALAAIAAALQIGIAVEDIRIALKTFQGVKRRFERLAEVANIRIYEDYAHHPKEIMSLLDMARGVAQRRGGNLYAIIQPHRYSRVKSCYDEFIFMIRNNYNIYITDIYAANETNIHKVSTNKLIVDAEVSSEKCDYLLENDLLNNVFAKNICKKIKANDIILFIGAGNVSDYAYRFVDDLRGLINKKGGNDK